MTLNCGDDLVGYNPVVTIIATAIDVEETTGLSTELTELATAVKTVPLCHQMCGICWIKREVEWFCYWHRIGIGKI